MEYRHFGNTIYLRLDPKEEILEEIGKVAENRAIISATAEIQIQVIDGEIGREFSEDIGLNLFKF